MNWIHEAMSIREAVGIFPGLGALLSAFHIDTECPQDTPLNILASRSRFPIALLVSCINRHLINQP